MPVVFDLRPGGDGEAKIGEDFRQFVHDLRNRVDATNGRCGDRQGHVLAFAGEACIECGGFEFDLADGERICDGFAQAVKDRPLHLAFIGQHAAERLEQHRDRSRFAHGGDAHRLKRFG